MISNPSFDEKIQHCGIHLAFKCNNFLDGRVEDYDHVLSNYNLSKELWHQFSNVFGFTNITLTIGNKKPLNGGLFLEALISSTYFFSYYHLSSFGRFGKLETKLFLKTLRSTMRSLSFTRSIGG